MAPMQDLFRRVFASRMVPASVAARMGVPHVKGLLMYGPPGTGKTLVARQIGRLLAGDKEPQVWNLAEHCLHLPFHLPLPSIIAS